MNATTEMVGYSHNAGSPRAELVGVFDDGDVGTEDARERRHRHFRALLLGMSPARRAAFVACWRASRPARVGYGPEDVGATDAQKRAAVAAVLRRMPGHGTGFFGKAGAKGLVKIAKIAAVGVAFVAPPVGAAAIVALSAADKLIAASEGPDKRKAMLAQKVIQNTATAARLGHPAAKLGLRSLVIAKRERARRPPVLRGLAGTGVFKGVLVLADGTLVRGHYRTA